MDAKNTQTPGKAMVKCEPDLGLILAPKHRRPTTTSLEWTWTCRKKEKYLKTAEKWRETADKMACLKMKGNQTKGNYFLS